MIRNDENENTFMNYMFEYFSILSVFLLTYYHYLKYLSFVLCCSFQAFSVVFDKAIDKAEPAEEVKQRVKNLIDCITFSVFVYTTRGLFEKDKLIFTTQMTLQILIMAKEINPVELDFLLRFPATPNVTTPVDFMNNNSWGGIKVHN